MSLTREGSSSVGTKIDQQKSKSVRISQIAKVTRAKSSSVGFAQHTEFIFKSSYIFYNKAISAKKKFLHDRELGDIGWQKSYLRCNESRIFFTFITSSPMINLLPYFFPPP